MSRLEQMTRAGYLVKVQWECQFEDTGRPELLALQTSPLRTRDALYGGRIESMSLHYKAWENETKQYVDVMSLYPYICKYFKFPVGHPVIHVGDACRRMGGLIKCSIIPPEKLFHPVLPFICNNKLMFCLCRTCVLTSSSSDGCVHSRDEDRALAGTRVMDEVRLALQKGYRILEIYEVYEYQVTLYDPKSGEGVLFVDYINTFLKLKAEASGYPGWVHSPEDKE